jgi:hypothetical protein
MVEQTAAASQAMAEQARKLAALVDHYRADAATAPQSTPRAPQAPLVPAVAKNRIPAERRTAGRPWQERKVPAPALAGSLVGGAQAGLKDWAEF